MSSLLNRSLAVRACPSDARRNRAVGPTVGHAASAVVACALAGTAMMLAQTYEALLLLAFPAIITFLLAAATTERREMGFVLGLMFGLSCYASGLHWLFTLLDGGDAPITAKLLPTVLFLALSVPTGIVGACLAGPRGTCVPRLLLVAPAVWIGFDWLRHQGDIAFPWFSIGYSQVAASPLAGYAPIGGILLVGLFTVGVCSLSVVALFRRALRLRFATGVIAVIAIGALLQQVSWTNESGRPLRVAVLQPNIGAPAKFDSSTVPLMLSRYESLIRSSQADVMLLPESALPLPAHLLPGYLEALRKHAVRAGTDVVLGAFETDRPPGSNYSSAMTFGVSGAQVYRKRQLVPFGEFIPWGGELYRSVQRVPFANTARGKAEQPLPLLGGGRVAIAICYDDVFGERMRSDAAASGWVANLTNDGWGDSQVMRYQHSRIAQARALEFGRPWLRAADTGQTGLIDARGRWVDSLPMNEVGALEADVMPRVGATPYALVGDRLAVGCCALMLFIALIDHVNRRRSRSQT